MPDSYTATLLQDGRGPDCGWAVLRHSDARDVGAVLTRRPGTFRPTGSMATARGAHTATPALRRRVLIEGGVSFSGRGLRSAEVRRGRGRGPHRSRALRHGLARPGRPTCRFDRRPEHRRRDGPFSLAHFGRVVRPQYRQISAPRAQWEPRAPTQPQRCCWMDGFSSREAIRPWVHQPSCTTVRRRSDLGAGVGRGQLS